MQETKSWNLFPFYLKQTLNAAAGKFSFHLSPVISLFILFLFSKTQGQEQTFPKAAQLILSFFYIEIKRAGFKIKRRIDVIVYLANHEQDYDTRSTDNYSWLLQNILYNIYL